MALRRYAVVKPDGSDGELFEADLPADAPDFVAHPVTGEPCRRIIEAPTLTTKYGDGAMKQSVSDAKLARHGFRKLEKDGDGGWTPVN
jgi:hypothetical protein